MEYDSYVNPSSDLRGEPEILRAPWRLHRAHSDGIPFKIEKKYTTAFPPGIRQYMPSIRQQPESNTTGCRTEYDRWARNPERNTTACGTEFNGIRQQCFPNMDLQREQGTLPASIQTIFTGVLHLAWSVFQIIFCSKAV